MARIIFDRSGKPVREVSTEGDTKNPRRKENRGTDRASCPSGEEESVPRMQRVPHR
jgi:hypothetical protein